MPIFFLIPRRGNDLCIESETCIDIAYPLNPPFQATRSHPGKAKNCEPKALNETMLSMRRKKSLTISHTQHRTPPIPIPISTKEKEWGRVIKKETHREQKSKKRKKETGEKFEESKLVKSS